MKLIVTDVDGTLVSDGAHNLNPEYFSVIRQLKEQGILFAVASGRQYPSIAKMFAPVLDDVIFIAENGAFIKCRDRELSIVPMNRPWVEEIILEMRQEKDCHLTASAKDATYIETDDPDFVDLLVNGYHNEIKIVKDILKEDIEIIKLALYHKSDICKISEKYVNKWQDRAKVVIAGALWLDFMDKAVDKGAAVETVQKMTGISKVDTICFGDNYNDLGMFLRAGKSYAVSSAKPEVKKNADQVVASFNEDGVLEQMKLILMEHRREIENGSV